MPGGDPLLGLGVGVPAVSLLALAHLPASLDGGSQGSFLALAGSIVDAACFLDGLGRPCHQQSS